MKRIIGVNSGGGGYCNRRNAQITDHKYLQKYLFLMKGKRNTHGELMIPQLSIWEDSRVSERKELLIEGILKVNMFSVSFMALAKFCLSLTKFCTPRVQEPWLQGG